MEWWGLACGLLGLVLGILALVRRTGGPDALVVERGRRDAVASAHAAMAEEQVQEWTVDLTAKTRLREEREAEWVGMFLDALGADREAFVAQWAKDSERAALAQQLRLDEEEAVRQGAPWRVVEGLGGLRYEVTRNPERVLGEAELERLRGLRERVLKNGVAGRE